MNDFYISNKQIHFIIILFAVVYIILFRTCILWGILVG